MMGPFLKSGDYLAEHLDNDFQICGKVYVEVKVDGKFSPLIALSLHTYAHLYAFSRKRDHFVSWTVLELYTQSCNR